MFGGGSGWEGEVYGGRKRAWWKVTKIEWAGAGTGTGVEAARKAPLDFHKFLMHESLAGIRTSN